MIKPKDLPDLLKNKILQYLEPKYILIYQDLTYGYHPEFMYMYASELNYKDKFQILMDHFRKQYRSAITRRLKLFQLSQTKKDKINQWIDSFYPKNIPEEKWKRVGRGIYQWKDEWWKSCPLRKSDPVAYTVMIGEPITTESFSIRDQYYEWIVVEPYSVRWNYQNGSGEDGDNYGSYGIWYLEKIEPMNRILCHSSCFWSSLKFYHNQEEIFRVVQSDILSQRMRHMIPDSDADEEDDRWYYPNGKLFEIDKLPIPFQSFTIINQNYKIKVVVNKNQIEASGGVNGSYYHKWTFYSVPKYVDHRIYKVS